MDIRSSLEGLKSILGVPQTTSPVTQTRTGSTTGQSALTSDQATLSSAGSAVSNSVADSGIRGEKVAEIQAALAAGSYNVPASAVASKVVDAMLSSGH
jgi:negative regulator of flagellin synthesis FlgM